MKNNDLKHFGVPGMRWGVRRDQPGGGHAVGSARSPFEKYRPLIKPPTPGSADHKTATVLRSKKVKDMTNDELKTVANRMDLERRYKDLNPSVSKRGQKAVSSVISTLGKTAGAAGSIMVLAAMGKKLFDWYTSKVWEGQWKR